MKCVSFGLACVQGPLLFKCFMLMLLSLSLGGYALAATHHNQDMAQDDTPPALVAPLRALVSPNHGRLENSIEAPIRHDGQLETVSFIIPANASNLQLGVQDRTVVRWTSEPISLKSGGSHTTYRNRLANERMDLAAQLATAQARIQVWKTLPQSAGSHDMSERQNMMEQALPMLVRSAENLEKRIKLLDQELAEMPAADETGKLITVALLAGEHKGTHARVNFSYDVPSCGWNAIYQFNARPDGKKGDIVEVHLLAEVWQYTGIDWAETEIVLATRGNGSREPQPLPQWRIGTQPTPQPRARAMSAKAAAHDNATMEISSVAPPSMAHVEGNTETVYASWNLSVKGLPEGRSRLEILSDAWEAPLQWLARPVRNDQRVWLFAKYTLPPNQAWPDGTAQYSVDNFSVGDGYFTPKGGEATLYFGADPRMQIHTTIDSSKQGESGIINTNQTWTWAWTYTVSNEHDAAVKVKVERPAPLITHDDITISYNDKPKATVDDKEHMLYWEVEVPGHGKSVIQHEITISAPVKLPLLPDVP